jgi:hypothetical protein
MPRKIMQKRSRSPRRLAIQERSRTTDGLGLDCIVPIGVMFHFRGSADCSPRYDSVPACETVARFRVRSQEFSFWMFSTRRSDMRRFLTVFVRK